jgi:hypothetical protein
MWTGQQEMQTAYSAAFAVYVPFQCEDQKF